VCGRKGGGGKCKPALPSRVKGGEGKGKKQKGEESSARTIFLKSQRRGKPETAQHTRRGKKATAGGGGIKQLSQRHWVLLGKKKRKGWR